ncbi:MAG: DUF4012 domain-containing protein [Chloroflexota bacterium]
MGRTHSPSTTFIAYAQESNNTPATMVSGSEIQKVKNLRWQSPTLLSASNKEALFKPNHQITFLNKNIDSADDFKQTSTISATRKTRRSGARPSASAPDPRIELFKYIPQLIGMNGPRTYLVLIQNNDELRSTGGFISAIGKVTVHRGRMVSFNIQDSYNVDDFSQPYPDAPEPLYRFMKTEIWLARDANWSPDFPTSAETFMALYGIGNDVDVDGVIAVDQFALQHVVEAFEPIQVPEWPEPATRENIIDLIRQSWSPEENVIGSKAAADAWWKNRKSFMSELLATMQQRVEQNPASVNWWKLTNAAFNVMERRHVQVWLPDPTPQAFFQHQGWDGALQQNSGDFLMVVETNLGFNKVNAVVDTSLKYEVDLTNQKKIEALLTVSHHNRSQGDTPCDPTIGYGRDYWSLIDRCYWNYLRIYSPIGNKLIEATPHAIPAQSLIGSDPEPARIETLSEAGNKTVWGTFLMVPHRQHIETSFHYQLPDSIIQVTDGGQHYHLDIQKQAGTWANDVEVSIQLPQNYTLISVTPSPSQIRNGLLIFELSLQTDQQIDVIFQ